MRAFWFALSSALLICLTGLSVTYVHADEAFEPITGVDVTEASATAAKVGGTSRLRFRIENFSGKTVVLTGVASANAETGAMLIKGKSSSAREANELIILPEEALDFKTSHIWLELRGLKKPLRNGDTTEFVLNFRQGTVPGVAHVHHHH